MSTTTCHHPQSLNKQPSISNLKDTTISFQELPKTTETKPPTIKVLVNPVLPYDERLRKFLERPSARETVQDDDNASSIYSSTTSARKEREIGHTLVTEKSVTAVTRVRQECQDTAGRRVYLTRRERVKEWWIKEKAEQKAFRNAMAPYFAF